MKIFLTLMLLSTTFAYAHDALVWGGPGACEDGCLDGAVHATKLAGFDPMIVTPQNYDVTLFETAKVWVQPGGKAGQASNAMGAALRADLKKFIHDGGGYVGFCAGAFLTTEKVGSTSVTGLGIVPGKSAPYLKSKGSISVQAMTTPQGPKYLYWEGGPYFSFNTEQLKKIDVKARYKKTNQIGSLDTFYGKGKISVTGLHPEAPLWWFTSGGVTDPDGLDNDLAASMIIWAAKSLY